MWETKDDIKSEILAYIARMEKAEQELLRLPTGFIDFGSHKKRELKRTELNAEIQTVRQIILYAKEAYDKI